MHVMRVYNTKWSKLTFLCVCYLLCVLVHSDRLIGVTTGNSMGAEGARHIGDGIRSCTGLTTLDMSSMQNVTRVHVVDVACCVEMLLLSAL